MKLRSIVLAGLLSVGVLSTTGCSSDEAKDFVKNVLKMSFVTVVNNADREVVHMTVPNLQSSSSLDVGHGEAEFYVVTEADEYSISDDEGHTYTFAKNTGNLFALCAPYSGLYAPSRSAEGEPSTGGFVTDINDGHRIGVVNLSDEPIEGMTIKIEIDENEDGITDRNETASVGQIDACDKVMVPVFDNLETDKVNGVWINDTELNIDPEEGDESLATALDYFGGSAKYDLVFFSSTDVNKGVIIPLVAPVPE